MAKKAKSDGIDKYVDRRRQEHTGPGKRFHDEAHFTRVLEHVAETYDEEELTDLTSLCNDGMTERQAMLIAATIGLDDAQNDDFMQILRAYNKLHIDYKRAIRKEEAQHQIDDLVQALATASAEAMHPAPAIAPESKSPTASDNGNRQRQQSAPQSPPDQKTKHATKTVDELDDETPTPTLNVHDYIAGKLSEAFAAGRFKTMDQFFDALEAVAKRYDEKIENPLSPANDRQVKIISAVLGLRYGECVTLALTALDELQEPSAQDTFSQYHDLRYMDVLNLANRVLRHEEMDSPTKTAAEKEENTLFIDASVKPTHAHRRSSAKHKKPSKKEPDAADEYISIEDDDDWGIEKDSDEPDTTAKKSRPESRQRKSRQPKPAKTSAEQCTELQFPENKTGNELLAYARDQKWTFSQLLKEVYKCSGGSQQAFSDALGIDRSQCAKLLSGKEVSVLPLMNKVAEKLGAKTDDEKTEWRKFMMGIPADLNQDMLNACLDTTKPEYGVDTEIGGFGHTVAAARLLKFLRQARGLHDRGQLGDAIATCANFTADDRKSLKIAINNLTGAAGNENIDPATIDRSPDKLYFKGCAATIPSEYAAAIATYAFPDDELSEERAQWVDFLTSGRYLIPAQIVDDRRRNNMERGIEKRREKAAAPVDLRTPENKTGNELLAYVRENSLTIQALLREILLLSGNPSIARFSKALGITRDRYEHIADSEVARARSDTLNAIAANLGADPEKDEEMIAWRKYILAIPPEVNQEKLNDFMQKVDVSKRGTDRMDVLKTFIATLRQSRGFTVNIDMLSDAAKKAGFGESVARQLQKTVDDLTDSTGTQIRTMSGNLATIMANYAFPENDGLRERCHDLLTGAKCPTVPRGPRRDRIARAF